ncbi:Uncharacterised protein [Yersinia pseudotuberculosis]|nr:Uncharacterised protein [Yersinia pseudotuberculosis]
MCSINLIATGSDIQFIGPDARIYFNGTGDQIGMILTTAVQALSLNNNFTPFNIVAGELAVIELRLTGGEGCAVGVDKTTALAGNACGVSDHHLRFTSGHFDIAVELTRVATVDFVEDHAGFAPRQPRITINQSGNLGLVDTATVIEDHPAIIDIKLAVSVARDAAATGGLDINLRRAVGAADNGRLLITRRTAIRHNCGLSG